MNGDFGDFVRSVFLGDHELALTVGVDCNDKLGVLSDLRVAAQQDMRLICDVDELYEVSVVDDAVALQGERVRSFLELDGTVEPTGTVPASDDGRRAWLRLRHQDGLPRNASGSGSGW